MRACAKFTATVFSIRVLEARAQPGPSNGVEHGSYIGITMHKGPQQQLETGVWEDAAPIIRATVDAFSNPVALLDETRRIILVNRRWIEWEPGAESTGSGFDAWCEANLEIDRAGIDALSESLGATLRGDAASHKLDLSDGERRSVSLWIRPFSVPPAAAMVTIETIGQISSRAASHAASLRLIDAPFAIDLKGNVTAWSPEAEQLFGRAQAELLGTHISSVFAKGNNRFPDRELLANLRRSPQEIKLRLRGGSGRFFDGRLSLELRQDSSGADELRCLASLLSERQRAVGALRRSEERLRYALEAASDGLWDWNVKTGRVVFSQRMSEIFGETSGSEGVRTAHMRTWLDRIHPDDDTRRQVVLDAHVDGRTTAYESEYRLRTGAGKWKWVAVRGRVTERDSDGNAVRMIGTITDINERKLAQEALRRSEEHYRNLFENASDAVVLFEPGNGRLLDANEKAQQLVGYSAEELSEMTIFDLHPADQKSRIEVVLLSSESQGGVLFEVDGLTKTGRRIPVETNARLVNYQGNQIFQSFIRDISKRRALEDQLRQSQKMETVGRLAGGIAHDFNNLLTAIQGYTTLLQSALTPGSEEREMSEEVFKAVQRASRLTMQLLTFSRREMLNPVLLDLNAVVEEMEKMLRRLIGEHVELRTVMEPELGFVEADRGSIEQVITNLVINAADAMPDGGTLTIQTSNFKLEPGRAAQHPLTAGDYVLLAVKDIGQGMDEETLSQIFEPFFTTKAAGTGTGLGLATVYGIIKQSQGHISVDSESGRGTVFSIYLPLHAAPRLKMDPAAQQVRTLPGRETVLIVEDEPAVRRLTRKFLEISGYQVVEAVDVAEAISATKDHTGSIDLLLTDVIMPDLSGPELAKRLRKIKPDLKVLYMSGYPGEFIARHGVSGAEMGYLQKPFSQEALAGKMREVLDSSQ